MKKNILLGSLIALVLAAIVWQWLSVKSPSSYVEKLEKERAQKDLFLRNSPESPMTNEAKMAFKGLAYFPIDEAYRVEATFEAASTPDTLILATTKGSDYKVIKVGKLRFTLQGVACSLVAYKYVDEAKNDFFIPFRDLSSGATTYGGGRYLDVPAAKDPIILDFNRAYHPYCVYNEDFVCPIPPLENRLKVEIAAGEKL